MDLDSRKATDESDVAAAGVAVLADAVVEATTSFAEGQGQRSTRS